MKILFCDNTLWGLLNFRLTIIQEFINQGKQVVLVAPYDDLELPQGARLIPVEIDRTGTNPLRDLQYYRKLRKIYKQEQPDYIFHYTIKPNIYGTIAAHKLGLRSSAVVAGVGHVFTKSSLGNIIAKYLYRYAMRYTEHILVLNKENFDILIQNKVARQGQLIWLEGGEGVDLTQFVPATPPSNAKPVFLMIARVLYDKGYAEYVGAGRELHDKAEFRLLGVIDKHPSAVTLKTIEADQLSGAIKYLGYHKDVATQIAKADCIVLPSFYGEGLSRVLMEALAMAKPIITTDIPGCRETVDHMRNGFICIPKSQDSLIFACKQFLNLSTQERQEMGVQGRKKAESFFDIKDVQKVYFDLLKQ